MILFILNIINALTPIRLNYRFDFNNGISFWWLMGELTIESVIITTI